MTRRLAAIGVSLVSAAVFLALMGIGGLPAAWTALGLWLAAVGAVVARASRRAEDA